MALNSSTVASGDKATADQYNNLRSDVVSTSSGHVHDGTLGLGNTKFVLLVAGLPLDLQNTTDAVSNQALKLGGGNRATPADNDEVYASFLLDDDLGAQTEFVRLTGKALDVTNTSKDSRPELQYYTANTLRELVFPAITADDTVVALTLAQTLTNKTLTSPVFTSPALGTPASGVMTNVTGIPTAALVDDAVTLAKMASGTDGNLITYDTNGDPAAVATGTANQVLTSNGAGTAPTFQEAAGVSQADQAAIEAETNENTYIPPDLARHIPGVAKAWVMVDADGTMLSQYYNMTSVTDTGVGDRTMVWDTDFSTASYAPSVAKAGDDGYSIDVPAGTMAAGSLRVVAYRATLKVDIIHQTTVHGDQA